MRGVPTGVHRDPAVPGAPRAACRAARPLAPLESLAPLKTSGPLPAWARRGGWGAWRAGARAAFTRWRWRCHAGWPGTVKRASDVLGALLLLAAGAPLWLFALLATTGGRWRLRGRARLGRRFQPFPQWELPKARNAAARWCRRRGWHRWPVLLNVLAGDMALVGPRAPRPCQLAAARAEPVRRFDARPGLVCLWWLRRRANIAYEREWRVDAEYVETQSWRGDVGIALRAIPAALYGVSRPAAARVDVLGAPIHNITLDEAVAAIADPAPDQAPPRQVCFVNADCANRAAVDAEYRAVLRAADLVLADGIGMKLAARWLGADIRQNVNGTDLFPRLCARLATRAGGVYLLGGRPGVPEAVADWIRREHPGVDVRGARHGYFAEDETAQVLADIARARPDVLLVALGAPRQDVWLRRHLPATGAKVGVGVGGLFDFFSGRLPRAPQWLREIGGEWLFRLWQEPGRLWRRYLPGNLVFLWRVWRARRRRRGAP